MKRGSLFFIGLISAIVTIIGLNFAFGNNYNHHAFYRDHYGCSDRYDHRYRDKDHYEKRQQKADSLNRNY